LDHLYKNFSKIFMITALTALLVLISLGLVVTVPVALATPGEWEDSKGNFNRVFQAWVSLVIVIAAADGIASAI
jgi:photosystem II core protein PsbZ